MKLQKFFFSLSGCFLLVVAMLLAGCDDDGLNADGSDLFNGLPYLLTYESNQEGTCRISNVRFNPEYRQEITLRFPEYSPSGDLVTAVCYQTISNLPQVICQEDFEEHILPGLAEQFGEDSFYYGKYCSFFTLKSSADAAEYPVAAVTPVYVLSPDSSPVENRMLENAFAIAGYSPADCQRDILHLAELVRASETEKKEEILQTLRADAVAYPGQVVSMEFPVGLRELDPSVYLNCPTLTSISLPTCVTSLDDYAFCWSTVLTSVTFGDTLTAIGSSAFTGCTGLQKIVLPQSLTTVGAGAFEVCTASVFYTGTEAQWNAIAGVSDSGSGKCTLYFYSESAIADGQHWHRGDGKPEVWQSNG